MSEKLQRLENAARKLAARKARIAVLERTLRGINQAREELAMMRRAKAEGAFDLTVQKSVINFDKTPRSP